MAGTRLQTAVAFASVFALLLSPSVCAFLRPPPWAPPECTRAVQVQPGGPCRTGWQAPMHSYFDAVAMLGTREMNGVAGGNDDSGMASLFHCIKVEGAKVSCDSPWIVEMGPREEIVRQESDGEKETQRVFVLPGPTRACAQISSGLRQHVYTQDISRDEGGTGHTATNAGLALAALVTDPRSDWYEDLNGRRVLELGCGQGLTGLSIAAAFPQAQVEMTDANPAVIKNVRAAVEAQNLSNVVVSRMDWNSALDPAVPTAALTASSWLPDLIVAADCIYHKIPAAFTATCLRFLEASSKPTLLLVCPEHFRPGVPMALERLQKVADRQLQTSPACLVTHAQQGQLPPQAQAEGSRWRRVRVDPEGSELILQLVERSKCESELLLARSVISSR